MRTVDRQPEQFSTSRPNFSTPVFCLPQTLQVKSNSDAFALHVDVQAFDLLIECRERYVKQFGGVCLAPAHGFEGFALSGRCGLEPGQQQAPDARVRSRIE